MQIQLTLESESDKNGIQYPRLEFKKKDEHQHTLSHDLSNIKNGDITEAVNIIVQRYRLKALWKP